MFDSESVFRLRNVKLFSEDFSNNNTIVKSKKLSVPKYIVFYELARVGIELKLYLSAKTVKGNYKRK
jgi:hypothetical protein